MRKIFDQIRNFLFKHWAILVFMLFGVLILVQFKNPIRFPYDFENTKFWKYPDLIAEFDFPLYKSEEQLNREEDSIAQLQVFVWEEIIQLERLEKSHFLLENIRVEKKPIKDYIDAHIIHNEKLSERGLYLLNDSTNWIPLKKEQLKTENQAKKDLLELGLSTDEVKFLIELRLQSHKLNKQKAQIYLDKLRDDFLPTQNQVLKGTILIKAQEKLSQNKLAMLQSYKRAYESGYWVKFSHVQAQIGRAVLIALFLILFYQFFHYFRPDVIEDSSKLIMILVLLFSFFSLSRFVYGINTLYLYIIPFPIIPFVLKAFFDTRLALFSHLVLILIISIQLASPFEFIIIQFIAGIFAILTTEGLYKRSQLFISVLRIIGVYCLVFFALESMQSGALDIRSHKMEYQYLIANGFLSLLAFPIIYSFERVFGLISDLSLLELSDINHPLLRELSSKAHGTFQHSLQVANLAESAALELGANTLLVRVGSMFHDIGKMSHPLYYIENQSTGINPHDELSYDESAKVIISHVKDGIQLAKKHKLPDSVIDFIRTHHGTTHVNYFYKKYRADFPEGELSAAHFTYPGPKPFSKETALVMMADAVEASSRSLDKPNRDSIDALVEKIIDHQVADGQFEQAEITLREISDAKKIFKKKLINIYHLRIEYPK